MRRNLKRAPAIIVDLQMTQFGYYPDAFQRVWYLSSLSTSLECVFPWLAECYSEPFTLKLTIATLDLTGRRPTRCC